MEKHTHTHHSSLIRHRIDPEYADPCTGRLADICCAAGIWTFGAILSSTHLALEAEHSQNVFFRRWQEVSAVRSLGMASIINLIQIVSKPIQQFPSTVVFGGIAICTVGYATLCMRAYTRTPARVAMAATVCIVLVFIEATWNGFSVNPTERLMVLMPIVVNAGLTWAFCRPRYRKEAVTKFTAV